MGGLPPVANLLWGAGFGVGGVATATFILRPRGKASVWSEEECDLSVRVATGINPQEIVEPLFQKHLQQFQVLGVATAKQGTALEVTYRVRFRKTSAPLTLVTELSRLEGVQNVEVHRED